MVEPVCSFCLKPVEELDLVVVGPRGSICESCAEAALEKIRDHKLARKAKKGEAK